MNTTFLKAARAVQTSPRARTLGAALLAATVLAFGPAVSQAASLDFHLYNQTNQPIVGIWASPTGDTQWGPAFNGTFVPTSGEQDVHFNDQAYAAGECYYDLRVQFSGGYVESFTNVNLCRVSGVRVYAFNGDIRAVSF
jgi:hypothetical protein